MRVHVTSQILSGLCLAYVKRGEDTPATISRSTSTERSYLRLTFFLMSKAKQNKLTNAQLENAAVWLGKQVRSNAAAIRAARGPDNSIFRGPGTRGQPAQQNRARPKSARRAARTQAPDLMGRAPSRGFRTGNLPGTTSLSSTPVAVNVQQRALTYVSAPKNIRHNILGLRGISLQGCQPLADVAGDGATAIIMLGGSLATVAPAPSYNTIQLSPDKLNGPVATQATFYERYCFRKLCFEWVSDVGSTYVGDFAMSFNMDPDLDSAPTSFSEVRQIQNSITYPIRQTMACLPFNYQGSELWYNGTNDEAGASIARERQEIQGSFVVYPNANMSATTLGYLNLRYELELYESVPAQAVTAMIATPMERRLIKSALKILRAKYNKGKPVHTLKPRVPIVGPKPVPEEDGGFELLTTL